MSAETQKLLIAPVDGSPQGLKAIDYLARFIGSDRPVTVQLVHVLPPLPPILLEEGQRDRETAEMLKKMAAKSEKSAKAALEEAHARLRSLGFAVEQLRTSVHRQAAGVARGICHLAEKHTADAIVMSTRGLGRLESFFLGATATKVADASGFCPVWLIKDTVSAPGVLIGVDHSQSALRAVDHAGFMLAGLDHRITLYYSRRNLLRFVPEEVTAAAPELEKVWQTRAGKEIAPVMEKARQMLLKAGVAESRIQVAVVEGSRSAGNDIVTAAREAGCGTIVVGRHGESGFQQIPMGSITRTVVQEAREAAVWVVP